MTVVGWLGIGMLAGGVVIALAGLLAVVPSVLSLRRRALAFSGYLAEEQAAVQQLTQERQRLSAETAVMLLPARTLARWLRHPLAIALIESYRRRRARR